MKPALRKILLICGLVGVTAALAAFALGYYAWMHRQQIVDAVSRELGVEHVVVAGIGLDRKAANLVVRLDDVAVHGIAIKSVAVALDVGRLVRDQRLAFSDLIVSDLEVDDALIQSVVHPPSERGARPDGETNLSLAAVWDHFKRFRRVRIENVRLGLAAIGVPGAIVLQQAVFERRGDDGAFFAAQALIRQQIPGRRESGTLTARCEIHADGRTLAIRSAHADIKDFDAPASYFAFFGTKLVDAPVLPMKDVTADAHVEIGLDDDTLLVAIEQISIQTELARATGAFSIDVGLKTTNYQVKLAIDRGDERVLRFLPRELLGRAAADWLAQNLKAAQVVGGRLELAGNSQVLQKLDLQLPVKQGRLSFAPDWPTADELEALVVITPQGLHASGVKAQFDALTLDRFKVDIASFAAPVVAVTVEATSRAPQALAALAKTPLRGAVAVIQQQPLTVEGELSAIVNVTVDISTAVPQVLVDGSATLLGVRVVPKDARIPPFEGLHGRVSFNREGLASEGFLKGQFDGMPASVRADVGFGGNEIVAHADVRGQYAAGLSSVQGPVRMQAKASLRSGRDLQYRLNANADLTDVAINIPGVVVKTAGRARTATIVVTGSQTDAIVAVESADLRAVARTALNADETLAVGAAVADGTRPLRSPDLLALKLDLAAAAGTLNWSRNFDHLDAELSHVTIPAELSRSAGTKVATIASPHSEAIDPRSWPSLNLHVADGMVYGRKLGEISLVAKKIDDGLAIDNIEINMGPASLYRTSGRWVVTPFGTDLKVAGNIHLRDSGRMLAALNLSEGIQGLHGEAAFDADWPNVSMDLSLSNLMARIEFKVAEGRIDKVDNLALKALDLLTLRFLELRESGLEIELAQAKAVLHGSQLTVEQAQVESPSARIKAQGRADLKGETLDANVTLSLKISRTLNAVALGVVNPLLALGYLSQDADYTVVKLDGLTEHSYTLTGPWGSPEVKLASGLFAH